MLDHIIQNREYERAGSYKIGNRCAGSYKIGNKIGNMCVLDHTRSGIGVLDHKRSGTRSGICACWIVQDREQYREL